jgi:hypothetical protein
VSSEDKCHECDEADEAATLTKCPVCHKIFCEEHAHHMSGRPFCSLGCAQYFFFAEPDD